MHLCTRTGLDLFFFLRNKNVKREKDFLIQTRGIFLGEGVDWQTNKVFDYL